MKHRRFGFIAAAMRPQTNIAAFICLLAAMTFPTVWGQTSVGRISGSVTDPTGAPVGDAKVTVTSTDTGSVRAALTDSEGFYAVTSLPIGRYTTSVVKPGFQKAEQKDL